MAKVIVVEKDHCGRVTDVREERICGPVCKTVKVVGGAVAAAVVLGALAGK